MRPSEPTTAGDPTERSSDIPKPRLGRAEQAQHGAQLRGANRSPKPYMSREERKQRATHDRVQLALHASLAPPAETKISRGSRNEEIAAQHLIRAGYRIIERNFRTKLGELDIIARDGTTLVFVEVRSRSTADFGQAIEMVTVPKQRKVTRMAWQYLKNRQPMFQTARFDVIGITAGELVHIKDAFRLG